MKDYNESEKKMWSILKKKGFNRFITGFGENISWISPCQKIMIDHPIINQTIYQISSISAKDYLTVGNKLNWELIGDKDFMENQLNKYYEN